MMRRTSATTARLSSLPACAAEGEGDGAGCATIGALHASAVITPMDITRRHISSSFPRDPAPPYPLGPTIFSGKDGPVHARFWQIGEVPRCPPSSIVSTAG